MIFLHVQHVSAAHVSHGRTIWSLKLIRVAASTSSSKPCLWRQFSSVSVAVVCCSSMRSRKKRNRFVRITNGCSQMNTVVIGLYGKPILTVVDSSMRIDIFFCFMMSSHSGCLIYAAMCIVNAAQETSVWIKYPSHFCSIQRLQVNEFWHASQRAPPLRKIICSAKNALCCVHVISVIERSFAP